MYLATDLNPTLILPLIFCSAVKEEQPKRQTAVFLCQYPKLSGFLTGRAVAVRDKPLEESSRLSVLGWRCRGTAITAQPSDHFPPALTITSGGLFLAALSEHATGEGFWSWSIPRCA